MLQQGGLLGAAPGVATAGGADTSQQGAHHHYVVLEENVIAQHESPLHSSR